MDLLERHGLKVSIIFMLLSMVVATMKNNETTELIVRGTEGTVLPVHIGRKVSLHQEMHVPVCPCDECQKQESSRRELDQEALSPKTSPLPPPTAQHGPPSDKSVSSLTKDTAMKALRLSGGVLSLSILLLPFFGFWTSGSVENALMLYSGVNLACTALASYGWLAYSVLQVSFKDQNEVIGIDAIIINGFSWGFVAFMLLVVLMSEWQARGGVCLFGLFVHVILTAAILQFPIFKWVRKESGLKLIIGVIACAFQNFAELVPIIKLVKMWVANAPEGGYPQIPSYKKFIVISRAFDSISTVYWMLYCVFTYEFDVFGISNIICGGLSLISLCAHAAWAMKPN